MIYQELVKVSSVEKSFKGYLKMWKSAILWHLKGLKEVKGRRSKRTDFSLTGKRLMWLLENIGRINFALIWYLWVSFSCPKYVRHQNLISYTSKPLVMWFHPRVHVFEEMIGKLYSLKKTHTFLYYIFILPWLGLIAVLTLLFVYKPSYLKRVVACGTEEGRAVF